MQFEDYFPLPQEFDPCIQPGPASRSESSAASKASCQKAGQRFKELPTFVERLTPSAADGPVPTTACVGSENDRTQRGIQKLPRNDLGASRVVTDLNSRRIDGRGQKQGSLVLRGPPVTSPAVRPAVRVSYPSRPFALAAVTKVTACQHSPAAPLRAGGCAGSPMHHQL
ncbi:hypothetical protein PFLUV_G00270100 [Perca fluviatilis]|uniref:Uncharacterized protein n=1 Tax=Perca fluviatilis TaxID=8168 RepID=A0A6A5E708_PERFL|nr:hypothetical protein PFLUV_G00270100 [Perca fluviatilis]